MDNNTLKATLLARVRSDTAWRTCFEQFYKTDEGKKSIKLLNAELLKKTKVYPRPAYVFRAFNMCPLNDVKVVLLGTRPFRSSVSNGLCFGVFEEENLKAYPMSVTNIHRNLNENIKNKELFLLDQGLEFWADQGVLMLNGALTSSPKGGHMNVWGWFIINVLSKVDNDGVVFVSFGDYPKKMLSKFIKKGIVINASDPSVVGRWSPDVFNTINNNLENKISWH